MRPVLAPPFARSLRLAFLALTLGAMLPVALLNLVETDEVLHQRADDRLLRHAEHTAARLDDELEQVRRWAGSLALHPEVRARFALAATAPQDAALDPLLRAAPVRVPPRAVRLLAPDGRTVAGVGAVRLPDPARWPAFGAAIEGTASFASAAETGEPATLLVPLRDGPLALGVAVVVLDTEALRRLVTADTGTMGEGSFGVLLDGASTRIADVGAGSFEAAPEGEGGSVGQGNAPPMAIEALSRAVRLLARGRHAPVHLRLELPETGEPALGVLVRLSEAPWYYLAGAPAERIGAPVSAQRRRLGIAALLGVAAALGASVIVSRRLAAPLSALEGVAARLTAGDREAVATPQGPHEARRLAEAINSLAAQVRLHEADLEAAVAARTAELEAARRDLELFAWSASHDLRSPLRTIEGFAEALAEDFGETLDPAARDYVGRIRDTALRMSALIDDLLALGKATRQPLAPADVNVTALCEAIAERLANEAPGRRAEFAIAPGLTLRGDPHLTEIALENLLRNAFKYSGRAEISRIAVRSAPGGGIAVVDNGVGFDRAAAHRLFEPFQRFHSGREFPGTGIGLATVQRVAARHGGRVEAESAPGAGATFTLFLAASA